MKLSRLTVRSLAIAVGIALAALAALAYTLKCRSIEFADKALLCSLRLNITIDEIMIISEESSHLTPAGKAKHDDLMRLLNYQERMFNKYRSAARSPWLPVEPDEPQPAEW
jgi:hypothetical protein